MRLQQLSALLSLPATILSLVIFPEAGVFSSSPQPQDRLGAPSYLSPKTVTRPKQISDVGSDLARLPPKFKGSSPQAPPGKAVDEGRLSPKDGFVTDMIEEAFEGHGVKITRLSSQQTSPAKPTEDDTYDQPLPVVIWHGLGDSADAAGLKELAELIGNVHPGTYTYIISVAGTGGSADRQASFFGNVTLQIEAVCHLLAQDNILRTAPAIDAIGFSQGGQFLRAYVQRCGSWAPKVRSLLTFGSQHNGIAEFQKCASTADWICQGANALLKSSTVWSDFIQSRLVPAQYYRDLNDYDKYLEHSNFLADVNNERPDKNATYAKNLAELEKFVMLVFHDDKTVIPRDSGWFDEVNTTSNAVTKLRDRPIYQEDWIGLKKLDEKGALEFLTLPGEHMQLVDKDLIKLFETYFGPMGKVFGELSTGESESWKLDL